MTKNQRSFTAISADIEKGACKLSADDCMVIAEFIKSSRNITDSIRILMGSISVEATSAGNAPLRKLANQISCLVQKHSKAYGA